MCMYEHYKNIIVKILILLILLFIVGLPINNLYGFYVFLLFLPIIIFSKIDIKKSFLYYLFFFILLFSFFKFPPPTSYIQEGHNLVILNKNSSLFYKKNFPDEIYDFFNNQFQIHYNKDCDKSRTGFCWRDFNPSINKERSSPTDSIFATSSDWSFNKVKYSRIVNDINISSLKSARIGAINNLDYNFFWTDITDFERENTPFYVMYEISKELINSSICWKGNLFWEQNNNHYLNEFNEKYQCTKIEQSNVNKKIYGASMGTKNVLILKLEKSTKLKIIHFFDLFIKLLVIISLIYFSFKPNYKLFFISILSSSFFILILYYVNKNLIYGFDIFTGGNDGLVYMSYGNAMFDSLINYNFYEFFRGAESVFYFPSSLRYFWPINKILFGETVFGYLAIAMLYPVVFFYIFKSLFGTRWSITLTLFVTFTRLFEGYALSLVTMLQHIHTGDAEPLAIFFLLLSVLIFLKFTDSEIKTDSKLYNFLFGFLLFLSVSLRPNFLPTAFIFVLAMVFYNFYYHKNLQSSFFSICGFLFILLIPLHNYYYGNSYVFFNTAHIYNTGASLSIYYGVFKDLIQLKLNQDVYILIAQANRWIQPYEIHYIVTFVILLILLIKNNHFVIRVLCLLALSQHLVLLVFEPTNRYAYLAWILTIILNFYFVKNNLLNSKLLFKIKKIFIH